LLSRIANTPAVLTIYSKIRKIPVLGEWAHVLMLRIIPVGTRYPTLVRKGEGAGLILSLDARFGAFYAAGSYETAMLANLMPRLREGDVLYDVGAHIGYVSLVAARVVGPRGRVFAFEADPENAARIAGHAQMNALPQVELVPGAVWSECRTLSFHRASASSSRNTGAIADSGGGDSSDGNIVVEAVTLDRFAEDHRPPAVVKIDVEGAEVEVLKGAEGVFRRSKPTLICEVHHGRAAEGVAAWLATMGYEWKWLGDVAAFPRHLVAQPDKVSEGRRSSSLNDAA
jgi:FkbM family methyltransferase